MKSEPRCRQLDYQERQTIAISLEQGLSLRAIGRVLGRSAATISLEVSRNSGGQGYSCRYAQQRQVRRRCHARALPKLVAGNRLFESITELLRQRWSPQQIAAHLAKLHPHEAAQRASRGTIYNVIYAQPRGELRKELVACLHMANLLSIHVRPPEIEDRQFPGHWEGDLIKGAGNLSAVDTLVERNTRLLILVKFPTPTPIPPLRPMCYRPSPTSSTP